MPRGNGGTRMHRKRGGGQKMRQRAQVRASSDFETMEELIARRRAEKVAERLKTGQPARKDSKRSQKGLKAKHTIKGGKRTGRGRGR